PAIAAGQQHSIAVLADSSVAAWGHNNLGQLGTGAADVVAHAIALQVPTIVTAASVQAGDSFSMALMGDSTVDAWGENAAGQVGNGTFNSPVTSPVAVNGLASIGAIIAKGSHDLARQASGTIFGWGDNSHGAVGDGFSGGGTATYNRNTPVQVFGLTTNVLSIGAGSSTSYAVKGSVPAAPTGVAAVAGNASATVSWTAPPSTGGFAITGYRVTPYVGTAAQASTAFASTAVSQTITGLTNGTA